MNKNNIIFQILFLFVSLITFVFLFYLIKRFSRFIYLKSYITYSFLVIESVIFSYLVTFYIKGFILYKKRIFGNLIKFRILNYILINLVITFIIFTSFNFFYNFNKEKRNNFYNINSNIEKINYNLNEFINKDKEEIKNIFEFIYKNEIGSKNLLLLKKYIINNSRINFKNLIFIKNKDVIILNLLDENTKNYIFENYLKLKNDLEFNFYLIELENNFLILSLYKDIVIVFHPVNQDLYKLNSLFFNLNTNFKKEYNNFLYSPLAHILIYISIFMPLIFIQIFIAINYVNKFNKPLNLLLKGFENLTYEEFKLIETKKSKDEIYYLIESFNSMQKELLRQKTLSIYKSQYESFKKITHKIAHEIKNPLTPITLSLQLILKKYPYNDEFKSYLEEKIKVALNHLNQIKQISEKLYFIENLETGENEEIELIQFFQDLINKWESEDVKILLKNKINDKNEIKIFINRQSLNSIFSNLIINSIEAKRKSLEIEIEINEENNKLVINYYDNGPGIPKEISNIVFEPFYTTKDNGTGLGLSIIKSILSKYGYNIEIVYDRKIGVHFKIDLGVMS
ncbi:MAG: ATP-binding protein [Spirochaetes bacterium]|nr:ATP-binding protein [Spirochaetota bacterium]